MNEARPGRGAYFALTRLTLLARGHNAYVSDGYWTEAWLVGVLIYLTGFFTALGFLLRLHFSLLKSAIFFPLLALALWPIWLASLHLNSLVIRALRAAGLWLAIPNREAQSFLLLFTTTIVAVFGMNIREWTHWVPAMWLGLVTLNAIAAIILRLPGRHHDQP